MPNLLVVECTRVGSNREMKSPREQLEDALRGGGTLRLSGGRMIVGKRQLGNGPRRYSKRSDKPKFTRPGGAKVIVTSEDCYP